MENVNCLRPSLLSLRPYEAEVGSRTADKLDANEFPRDMPEWFKKKLSLVWEKGIHSNRYPDGSHRSLKRAIADYAGVSADRVTLGNGSDELIRSLLMATCLEGRGGILVADPTFSMYAVIAQTLGIPVVSVPRHPDTFALDISACQTAIETQSIRAVFLVSPNSPTGNALTTAELDWVRALPASVMVVIDEAYYEFSQQTVVDELGARPNWVVMRTFSKAFRLAAHRVGYALAHPTLVQVLEALRLPYNLPTLSQWAAQLALEGADELLADIPDILRDRDRLWAELNLMSDVRIWPSAANFLYFRVNNRDLSTVQQTLSQHGSLVRHTGGGLRLTVGTPAQNQRFINNFQSVMERVAQPLG